jgi:hypothetical protein
LITEKKNEKGRGEKDQGVTFSSSKPLYLPSLLSTLQPIRKIRKLTSWAAREVGMQAFFPMAQYLRGNREKTIYDKARPNRLTSRQAASLTFKPTIYCL